MDFFDSLEIEQKINAATTYTAIGGSLMPQEVIEAMNSAAGSFVDMRELQAKAGAKIAQLTKNEGAFVTAGCAAAIVLSILALRTKGDVVEIDRVITGTAKDSEVIIQTGHRINYDAAIKLAGSKIIAIGDAIETHPWQLESAINEKTTAIFFVAGTHLSRPTMPLHQVVEIARSKGIPVVVDAAAQLPPMSNFWEFTKNMGAELVLFSGGKALRGPQASGLILGKEKYIEAIQANASPNGRLARAMKVGKEEIAGLTAAVERFVNLDHGAELAKWNQVIDYWYTNLSQSTNASIEKELLNEAGQPVPRLRITPSSGNGVEVVEQLRTNRPSIEVVHNSKGTFWLSADSLKDGEAEIVLTEALKYL
jgi:L-seryl-tRNA(Ser) seleniumtransferase